MLRAHSIRFALTLLLAAILLLTRVGGVHLHLCFDGMEPRVAVHLQDGELHHVEPGANTTHHDVDVAAAGDVLSKFKTALFSALLLCFFVLPLLSVKRALAAFFASRVVYATPHFLRPPLRGPPALIRA